MSILLLVLAVWFGLDALILLRVWWLNRTEPPRLTWEDVMGR